MLRENSFKESFKLSTENVSKAVNGNKKGAADTAVSSPKLIFCWRMVFLCILFHVGLVYGGYLAYTKSMWQTNVFAFVLYLLSTVSVTAGVHRLWSHRAYKAKLPLHLFLLFFYTMINQGSVLHWVRDHRVHHKHTDTNADPYNSNRGFFFSHIGWLLVRKHPDVIAKGRTIDVSDILNDPWLRFQHKYYSYVAIFICYVIPTYIPTLWGEDVWTALIVAGVFRHMVSNHAIGLINSAAHTFGSKPYDKNIRATENMVVSLVATGEGFHNYHHTFPWDYKAAELGGYSLNLAALFIDVMAKIGWAYDLKTVSGELIEKRVKKSGDGSHPVWGWNDNDMPEEDRKSAVILCYNSTNEQIYE